MDHTYHTLPGHLVEATKHRDLAALKSWLSAGHDLHMRDREGATLLRHAFNGEGQITWTAGVLLLLESGRYDPNCWPNITGTCWRPLHFAACSGQVAIAEVLLDSGVPIDQRTGGHPSMYPGAGFVNPLCLAASHSRLNMIRFLLSRGAALHATRSNGQTAEQSLAPTENRPVSGDAYFLLRDVRLAGGWKRYVNAPRKSLLILRELCAHGRAAPSTALLAASSTRLFFPSRSSGTSWAIGAAAATSTLPRQKQTRNYTIHGLTIHGPCDCQCQGR